MKLLEFLLNLQTEIRSQISDGSLFAEEIFSEQVMQHMADVGMTWEPVTCQLICKVGNANLKLSGYAFSDDHDQLDLFVSLYAGAAELLPVTDQETKVAAEQCLRFLSLCAEGRMAEKLDETHDARSLANSIHELYNDIDQIRIFVLTDRVAKSKNFKAREIGKKSIHLEVMDIERLHRHWSEGKPRDELVADFTQISGSPLPCVFVPGVDGDYDYALTAIPGDALRLLYEKFGNRLLEANVRSFLSVKSSKSVNAGIQNTLRNSPDRFMAYNNGIVVIADEVKFDEAIGISWLKGIQVVNGGQTTASIYFTKRKYPDVDLTRVRVPAKIIVMRSHDSIKEEALVSDISRFANSQNAVKQSDLSANKPYHIEIERLSLSIYCPDGVSRWFYERAAGSYTTMLARDGTTPARLKALKDAMPTVRRFTKTDLARYINAWDKRPDFVSLGSQKNFDRFMESIVTPEGGEPKLPTVEDYKLIIAKAKLYRDGQKKLRPLFTAFQANVLAYSFSVLSHLLGDKINLERIWLKQAVSNELLDQLATWASEVNALLHSSANGRMISEWAKKAECKDLILNAAFTPHDPLIPELTDQ